jgi:hypothetical protein
MATTKLNNGQLPTTLSSKTIDSSNTINTDLTKLSITGGTNGQVLSTNGSGSLSWATAGGMQTQVDTFTSSGTWTKPAWAKRVEVYLVGGGAGGSSGARRATTTPRVGGGGGVGGAIAFGYFNASFLGSTESITVGAGGTGGASVTTNDTAGNIGNAGGRTLFGSHFQAPGGPQAAAHQSSGTGNSISSQVAGGITGINPAAAGTANNAAVDTDFGKSGGGSANASANVTTTNSGFRGSNSYSNGSTLGYFQTQALGGAGGTDGGNGGDGSGSVTLFGVLTLGNAGGGGSYKTAQATGRGGDASNYGAGGGGGAGADNGFASGRGGNGSGGMAVVISIG